MATKRTGKMRTKSGSAKRTKRAPKVDRITIGEWISSDGNEKGYRIIEKIPKK